MSEGCLSALAGVSNGAVICRYNFSAEDILPSTSDSVNNSDGNAGARTNVPTYNLVVWKGKARAVNVMSNKIDLTSMKNTLSTLGAYRPKLASKAKESSVAAENVSV